MIKVLQFIPSVNVNDGGTTTYMQQLTACLGQMCELHVCALTPVEQFVPLSNCLTHSIPNDLFRPWSMKHAWMTLLDEIHPDVVHVNCCWLPQIALVIRWTNQWRKMHTLSDAPCLKLILTPHGMLEPWILNRNYWTRKLPAILLYQRYAVSHSDLLIATAEEEKKHLLDLGWNSHVALVPNGIDVDSIVPKSVYKNPTELLFMSRIHPKKGLDMMIDALNEVKNNFAFHLTIAGSGDESYISELKAKIDSLGMNSAVTFVGPVYGEQKWQLLRDEDVVVLPSYSENYGLIVAEALASGTPVLTTKGTPWQSLEEHACGWWIELDVVSIAATLQQVLTLPADVLESMGKRARTLAEIDCAISQKVSQMYNLYLSKHA